jgi:DNA-binding MarR family transcriptional regulator
MLGPVQKTLAEADPIAVRLTLAFSRLKARLREESGANATGLSIAQLSILQRLHRAGPATAASLAASEHVSQQAIAQSVASLKAAGLVRTERDPNDRRKVLISITDAGLELRESMAAARTDWLERTIGSMTGADERAVLERGVELLERFADAGR